MPFNTAGVGVFGLDPVFPEIWIVDDDDFEEARKIVTETIETMPGEG